MLDPSPTITRRSFLEPDVFDGDIMFRGSSWLGYFDASTFFDDPSSVHSAARSAIEAVDDLLGRPAVD